MSDKELPALTQPYLDYLARVAAETLEKLDPRVTKGQLVALVAVSTTDVNDRTNIAVASNMELGEQLTFLRGLAGSRNRRAVDDPS